MSMKDENDEAEDATAEFEHDDAFNDAVKFAVQDTMAWALGLLPNERNQPSEAARMAAVEATLRDLRWALAKLTIMRESKRARKKWGKGLLVKGPSDRSVLWAEIEGSVPALLRAETPKEARASIAPRVGAMGLMYHAYCIEPKADAALHAERDRVQAEPPSFLRDVALESLEAQIDRSAPAPAAPRDPREDPQAGDVVIFRGVLTFIVTERKSDGVMVCNPMSTDCPPWLMSLSEWTNRRDVVVVYIAPTPASR